MKVLVLGATGLVGTAIIEELNYRGIESIPLSGDDINIEFTDEVEKCITSFSPDVVINCVALQAINKCELYPIDAFRINTLSLRYLSKLCNERDITLIHFGSHIIFDGLKLTPYTEEDNPNPNSIYAITKYMGEFLVKNNVKKYYILRIPTIFGQRKLGYKGITDKIIDWIENKDKIRMADDSYTTFTYSKDVAKKTIDMLINKEPYGIYHISNKGMTTYYEFANEIKKLLNSDVTIEQAKDEEFKSLGYKPNNISISSSKGGNLRYWKEALKEYING